jgi:dTDP-4-dehydrorhamnose reductase
LKLDSIRVLVTGASGSLGWALSKRLLSGCEVVATYNSHPSVPGGTEALRLDLSDRDALGDLCRQNKPDVIFHCAAMTAPDDCEQDSRRALRVNFEATLEIARIAKDMGSRLVFTSTDLVFDGSKGDYREEDAARPLSIYGMSKLRAEEAVLGITSDSIVVRSSLIYGKGSETSGTFLTGLADTLAGGREMMLFTDQLRNPILVDDLVGALTAAVEEDLTGLYHVAGREVLTRFEFGREVCRAFGYDETLLVPISMESFDYVAARPPDSTLNTEKFTSATGFQPTGIAEALAALAGDMA